MHSALTVAAGSLLGLLPHRVLQMIVAVLFGVGAVLLLRGRHEEGRAVMAVLARPVRRNPSRRESAGPTQDGRPGLAILGRVRGLAD